MQNLLLQKRGNIFPSSTPPHSQYKQLLHLSNQQVYIIAPHHSIGLIIFSMKEISSSLKLYFAYKSASVQDFEKS